MLINVALLLALIYFIIGLKRPGAAVVTVPVVCFVFVWAATLGGEEELMQAILGVTVILVATVTSALLSRCEPGLGQWPKKWIKWLLLGLAAVLFVVTGFAVTYTNVPSLAFPILWVLFAIVLTVGTLISYGLTSRQTNAALVFSTIGASMRQNLPLAMALESAASGANDKQAMILTNISKWLVRGCSISESVERGFPKCPPRSLALIKAAEQINQLPMAFESIEADIAAKSDEDKKMEPVEPYYPAIMLIILFSITSLLMTFVMPSFIAVIEEMTGDMQLPRAAEWLFSISNFVFYEYGWALSILPIALIIPFWSYLKFRRRRPYAPPLSTRAGDFLKWHLPALHTLTRNSSMVQVCEMLRLSLNAGCTVNDSIERTLGLDINNCLRRRLGRWLKRVESGENISLAAIMSRLPRPIAWAFDDKVNQGNTPTILGTLESMYRSDYNCRTALIRAVLNPCVTICLAAAVGFVVYAMYSMPIAIIYHTIDIVYP